jgi:hypothetical protein
MSLMDTLRTDIRLGGGGGGRGGGIRLHTGFSDSAITF